MKDINLLLKEEKNAQGEENVQEKSSKAASLAKTITILIIIAAFVIVTLAAPKIYISALDSQLKDLELELKTDKYIEIKETKGQLEKVAVELSAKEEIISFIESQGYTVGGIMKTIKNNIPEGCSVNNLEFDYSSMRIAVKFKDIANIAEFLLNIEKVDYISLSNSSRNLKINNNGEYVFKFDLGKKTSTQEVR